MIWNNRLYCTHPYHVIKKGHPEHISRELFSIKNCGNQKGGLCKWAVISQQLPTVKMKEDIKQEFNKDKRSKNKLIELCQQKDKKIKMLTDEVIELSEKLDDLDQRHRLLMTKLMNLKVEV